jgi:lambda family phage portal protein
MGRFQREASSLPEAFENIRSDYNAARENRFRRRRRGYLITGSNADFHYRLATDYLRMIEYARAMDRDDAIMGCTIDKAVTSTLHTGFTLDVKTGDKKLDKDLKARWTEWAEDAEQCDLAGEHTFAEMENLILRSMYVDGDHFALPTNEGSLQLLEGHLCRTPRNAMRNKNKVVIHGVMLGEHRRRLQYWFCKEDIDPWVMVYNVADMRQIDARDEDGERQVFQIYNPKRVSQTRGVSAIAPIIDCLGMFEDINFARLIQQQIVSCFAVFRERDSTYEGPMDPGQQGDRQTFNRNDGSTGTIEGIRPGMQITGYKGEKLTGFAPQVPNAEFFPHIKLILTLIGINLGLPLIVVLMDASDTNFSSWRGPINEARLGWRRNQRGYARTFHKPTYRWKVRDFIAEDLTLRKRFGTEILRARSKRSGIDVFGHGWGFPAWPYIDPQKDAAADLLRVRNGLASHRQLCHERGDDWGELSHNIVDDNFVAIQYAVKRAREMNAGSTDASEKVHWRELISLPTPDGINVRMQTEGDIGMGDATTGSTPGGGSGKQPAGGKGGKNG